MKRLLASILIAFSALTLVHADDYPLKTCIVSGDILGGDLGPAIPYNYKGRDLKFCCKSCVKTFNKNPDKYLKLLDAAEAKANGGK